MGLLWDGLEAIVDLILPSLKGIFRLFGDPKTLIIITLIIIAIAIMFIAFPITKSIISGIGSYFRG